MVSALLLLAGAFLPLLFLVALFGRLEQARLAASQAAWATVRAAVLAPSAPAAQTAAATQLAAAQQGTVAPLTLRLSGSFVRGGALESVVTATVGIGELPWIGSFGSVRVAASARAPVAPYRSLPVAT
jgi:hypothetical protein